ncbi:MAG TPA: hypothetical protein VFN20_09420 [Candidatus Acidoferrum sp.]|nr:hypothetical protein [Candidatus Acidoferrum sp.]
MPDQPQPPTNDRFKAEMPQIPGVGGPEVRRSGPGGGPWLVVGGLAAVLVAVFVGGRVLSKSRRGEVPATPAQSAAQIDVPAGPAVPDLPVPVATESDPVVAQVGELAKPWDAKPFRFRNKATGENVPALLIRLPGGAAPQAGGYWALAMKAAYGSCQLEYVQDLETLRSDYSLRRATHPMIGNPCSRTVYDPLKYAAIPGNLLARGAIVQGTDLRPPLGIEVKVRGKDVLAVRME